MEICYRQADYFDKSKIRSVKMKIGIITYHYALNYGAVLQCYALKSILEKNNNEVFVINYEDENQHKNSSMYNHGKGIKRILYNMMFLPFHFYRKRKFNRFKLFVKDYLNITERIDCEQQLIKHIEDNKYDFIFVGSDQVWNPNIKDFTCEYFLPFEIKAKKISYAACFGDATWKQLEPYKKYIKDFNRVSLRENKFKEQISQINNAIKIVPDPVFLISKKQWGSLIKENYIKNKEPYLLCYFMNKKNAHANYIEAKKIAKELGLKIVRLNPNFSLDSLSKSSNLDAGPIEFINYMYYANFICTDSFHGTAFSIVFKKDFYVFDKNVNKKDLRKSYLLDEVGLKDRLILGYSKNLIYKIDYEKSNEKIISMIKNGNLFIEDVIEKNYKEC